MNRIQSKRHKMGTHEINKFFNHPLIFGSNEDSFFLFITFIVVIIIIIIIIIILF